MPPFTRKSHESRLQILQVHVRQNPDKDSEQGSSGTCNRTGALAKHVAYAAKRMVATDYSEGMIREAQKGKCVDNLIFEVADATDLPYENHSF